jgi:diguanylate cyclase (GGDEF)-like protein/PAS domain S-box-containing protein
MNPDPAQQELVATYVQTAEGRLLDCNGECARILGYASRAELLGVGALDYANISDFLAISGALTDLRTVSNIEVALRRKDGAIAWVLQNVKTVSRDGQDVFVAAMFDVTEQRAAVQRFEFQAFHDTLTTLPNRALFADRLNVALAQSKRRGSSLAVMLLNIDSLTSVNAAHGVGVGDRLLKGVADRLYEAVREEDALARFAGDEFLILLGQIRNVTDAAIVAQRFLDAVARPFQIGGATIKVTASIGISVAPHDSSDGDILIRNAVEAVGMSRERSRNSYYFHEPRLNARMLERTALLDRLRRAVDRNEFELHYQPQVNVQTGRIDCIEALIRWHHPELGIVLPNDFLHIAEQGGLGPAINQWVLAEACRQAVAWRKSTARDLRIAVNVSDQQFGDGTLGETLGIALAEYGVNPAAIEIEVAEPSIASNTRSGDTLRALHDLGVMLAIDDFGSGGCSLSDLKHLPVDTIKIAPAFVHHMLTRQEDAAIVQAMVTVAKGLDLRIVAEGVESREQLAFLRERRCTEMQGYFLGRPMPAMLLEDTLRMQH